ncbi:hypothetical protein [Pseudodesulfovibrio senegalensis]|jgi:hypothetical protein|uniref:Uncharacterized protein n=1 Tax=Pseudodesulfovibrio senegalensis TaxID=1721087 RepID=A0A6N6MZK9_9BACT|nr:hypothetical protein [Pseudodesulfovibrio senegalensis]KAB1441073.1 hypothetical protein F8A88_11580 [Pseudodesulfovibrio senegalensis]
MTTVMPQSELTRKAIKWICESMEKSGEAPLNKMIEQAAARFNLSPLDVEFLQRFFREQGKG